MALDGIVLSNIVNELKHLLIGGRIDKINQPEKDEIIILIRNNKTAYRLLLSAEASFPRLYLTNVQKNNPITAPSFCMLLRKYMSSGRIIDINQPNFERIVKITFEHLNELGDLCKKSLIIEIMGRHSNIILCDEDNLILDSIKHVNSQMSSIREVFPGKYYSLPPSKNKSNPLTIKNFDEFKDIIMKPMDLLHALYNSFTGFSPLIAKEICFLINIDPTFKANELTYEDIMNLYKIFEDIVLKIKEKKYAPYIILDDNENHIDFYSFYLNVFSKNPFKKYDLISSLLDDFFKQRSNYNRINQKSADIRKIVQNNYDRCLKKYELQKSQLEDAQNRDIYKLKGELINANIYQIKEGETKVDLYDYYDNTYLTISLDPNLTPIQNSQKYYAKYNKKKRTYNALLEQLSNTKNELNHLESIKFALEIASSEEELVQIKSELINYGYIKFKKSKSKKNLNKSVPLHYISSDGFDIYVGKNNLQNEELTLKFARNNDWWFHAKDIPGSHVIVKSNGKELTDKTFEEAAKVAAFYSKAKDSDKVTVDYTLKKNIKKPNGSVPGYVIYHTNYSIVVEPNIKNLKEIH